MPTVKELKAKAKALGLKGYHNLNKFRLLDLIARGPLVETTNDFRAPLKILNKYCKEFVITPPHKVENGYTFDGGYNLSEAHSLLLQDTRFENVRKLTLIEKDTIIKENRCKGGQVTWQRSQCGIMYYDYDLSALDILRISRGLWTDDFKQSKRFEFEDYKSEHLTLSVSVDNLRNNPNY
jgi:hypothetical protein